MKDLVIILGSSVTPQHHHHTTRPKTKPHFTKLSPFKPPPPSASPPIPVTTLHSHSPLFYSVRRDTTARLEYYADLASKVAEDGRLEDFTLIVETIVVSGVSASRFAALLNTGLLAKGISRNLRQGKVSRVVETMRKMDKLGVAPLKMFDGSAMELMRKEFRRMVNCGEVEETVRLMEILAGFRFRIKELVDPYDVVKICVDNCNAEMAVRHACLLPHAHILFCRIINEFGKKSDLVSALTAYEASKQHLDGHNMYIYRTTIDVCGLCGDYMKSRYIYEDLLKQNVTPNIYVFNSLMNANAHDWGYTLDLYKNMQNLGITADMASYNILLKACCLAGRVDLALDIYKEAKRLESAGGLKLDVFTYCTIIKVFADARLWQMALKVKEDMQSAGVTPNTITWSALISACANAGLVEQAIKLFEEMIQAGCEPNAQCCNILLHTCVEACQYDRAFRLFSSWKGCTVQETFSQDYKDRKDTILSVEQNTKDNVASKLNYTSHSPLLSFPKRFSFTPTSTTYNILLKACGTDFYRAKALMDEMKTLGLPPNNISWSILIDICGGSGNVEGAIQTLKIMQLAGTKPDVVAYTTAIKVCVKSKNLKSAFSLFEEMKRNQIQPNMVTYNTLLRARSRYGSLHEVQQCLGLYQEMRKAGYKPNDYYLKELIEEWCEGVIQDNIQNQGKIKACKEAELQRPQSLLLEKVAAHLQKSTAENLAIDLQGLTKVEARIVVLAVLRMVKENYVLGDKISDDMLIVLGISRGDSNAANHIDDVKDTVIKLLHDQLGLQVLSHKMLRRNKLPIAPVSSTRRPAILERLKVTKKSLHCWLQQRVDNFKR